MKRNIILVLVLFAIANTSCKKYLNTLPTDFISPETFYRNETELNAALMAVYDVLGNRGLYGRNLQLELGLATDEGFCRASTGVLPYFYNHDASDANISACWNALYQGIERANLLLANIDKASGTAAAKDVIRGQALFLRAYYYFILTTNWGDVPVKLKPAGSLSETATPRTPAKDMYAMIIKDMTTAEGLVKGITDIGFGGLVSKSAVQGILAKVCLHAAGRTNDNTKYALALKWSEKVITSGLHSLNADYKQVFINYLQDKYDTKESIWEVEFSGNNIGTTFNETENYASAFGVLNTDESPVGYSYALILSTNKFYNTFSPVDKRRDWIISNYTYSGNRGTVTAAYPATNKWRYIAKYRRDFQLLTPKDKNYGPTNFPLLRYADVLLMYAEASNYVNHAPNADAYRAINQVRRRGAGLDVNVANATADLPAGLNEANFLAALKDERLRELAFEGIRKLDLIRWGTFLDVMKEEINDVNVNGVASGPAWPGKAIVAKYYENVSQRHLLLPIPQSEISLNGAIGGQNPLW